MFQSHNGAIAAVREPCASPTNERVSIPQWCDCCLVSARSRSRLRRVAIPQWCDCCLTRQRTFVLDQCFNPTMVRLLRRRVTQCRRANGRFQSHNGAIAAVMACRQTRASTSVSIPQWCDCCFTPSDGESTSLKFQSHNGAIAACLKRSGQNFGREMFQSHNGAIAA